MFGADHSRTFSQSICKELVQELQRTSETFAIEWTELDAFISDDVYTL